MGGGGLQAKYRANIRAITLAKEIDAAKRSSTPDERKELAKYVGWGGMKGVFDPDNKGWAKQHAELKALLTQAEWKAASKSQRNAHYTSVPGDQAEGLTRAQAEARYREILAKWGSSAYGKMWKPSTPLEIKTEMERLVAQLQPSRPQSAADLPTQPASGSVPAVEAGSAAQPAAQGSAEEALTPPRVELFASQFLGKQVGDLFQYPDGATIKPDKVSPAVLEAVESEIGGMVEDDERLRFTQGGTVDDGNARVFVDVVPAAEEGLTAPTPATLQAAADRAAAAEKADAKEQQRLAVTEQLEAVRAMLPQRETITPADDKALGANDAGEPLYERKDGSRYRMHYGRPDFGGDLVPVKETAPEVSQEGGAGAGVKGEGVVEAGENLRYNRRNFAGTGLTWTDILAMDPALQVRETVKGKVWPRPDYQALIDAGAPPLAARAIKQVYDGIAAKPAKTDEAALKRYTDTLAKVRKTLEAWLDDKAAMAALREDAPILGDIQLLGRLWPEESAKPRYVAYAAGTPAGDEVRAAGANKFLRALQFDRSDIKGWREDIADGWPASKEAWERQGLSVVERSKAFTIVEGARYNRDNTKTSTWVVRTASGAYVGSYESREAAQAAVDNAPQGWIVFDKAGRVAGNADTEEAAKDVARERVKRAPAEGAGDTGYALEEASRVGPERRAAGKDVSAQELMDAFGLRGVNFGRKGYIGDELRQAYLNAAYDGLMDLAELLALPPKALSLNGQLGLAFGAQGRGGRAAAHFVPGVNEINLTRDAGAGTIAHEWGHAVDHYFAVMAGLARDKDPFLSAHAALSDTKAKFEGPRKIGTEPRFAAELRPEILAAFKALHEAMNKRPVTQEMRATQIAGSAQRAGESLDKWIAHMAKAMKSPEARAEFDALAAKLRAGDLGDGYVRIGRMNPLRKTVGDMATLLKAKGDKAAGVDVTSNWKGLDSAASHFAFVKDRRDADDAHVPQGATTRSLYAIESGTTDKGKGGKEYWGTEWEKFARAFETWVSDALKARNLANTFLSDGGRRADDTGEKRMPYPRGSEREAMGKAFEALVGEFKTREDDAGNVAMFSQRPSPNRMSGSQFSREQAIAKLPANIRESGDFGPERTDLSRDVHARAALWERAQDFAQEQGFPAYSLGVDDIGNLTVGAAIEQGQYEALKGFADAEDVGVLVLRNAAPKHAVMLEAGYKPVTTLGLASGAGRASGTTIPLGVAAYAYKPRGISEFMFAQGDTVDTPSTVATARAEIASLFGDSADNVVTVAANYDALPPRIAKLMRDNRARGVTLDGKRIFIVADQVSQGDVRGLVMHELGVHYAMSDADIAALTEQVKQWAKGAGTLADMAQWAMRAAQSSTSSNREQETLAYMVQALTDAGMTPNKAPRVVRSFFARIVQALRAALRALGLSQTMSPQDVVDFVYGAAKMALERGHTPSAESAFANESRFAQADPTNPDIRFSQSLPAAIAEGVNDVRSVRLPAGYIVGDLFNSAGKLHWWHKTVGTQHNLAQRSPLFRRVYDAVQTFLGDVSLYAIEAANEAPRILPKLETWRDLGKAPLSATDTKAISAPIFEGTLTWARDEKGRPVRVADLEEAAQGLSAMDKAHSLMRAGKLAPRVLQMWQGLPLERFEAILHGKYERDMLTPGVVWSDAELRSMFSLNDAQIGLYREFRKATDLSLQNLAISDMIRFGGKDVEAVREQALAAKSAEDAAMVLRDHLFEMAESDPDRADLLNDTANKIVLKADRAKDLMDRGYAPLSRFGSHTVYVVDQGEQVYFGMFETSREAARMARQMREQFPDAQIQRGTVSQEEFKLFAGVSPETLALFGEMLGLEQQGDDEASRAFQTYLKLAKNNRSAMKRLIHRKGIAGFNEDVGRVLAGFVYSNARQTATNLHMGEITTAANEIPKAQGELKDAAVKLTEYIKNPQEEAQAVRGVLFAQYLGGSVASALVNMTQPLAVTFPYLSQYLGPKAAAAQVAKALADVNKASTGDADLDAALTKAEEEGIVSPQEVHQLMAQARGQATLRAGDGTVSGNAAATASNALSRLSVAWGKVFGLAEQINRRATFIAAYRTAIARGMKDPAGFAVQAVKDTQFVYNKGCVDEETECLTADGWKRHDALRVGESVFAVDADGRLVDSVLQDVHRYADGPYAAIDFRNANGFSMVLTPEHRCLIQNYNSRDLKFQKPKMVRADGIKVGHHFMRVPLGDATGREAVYSDDEVALFAWVAAEGSLHATRGASEKRQVRITQSERHNPTYCAEIDGLLQRLGGAKSYHYPHRSDNRTWVLKAPLSRRVLQALPGKMLTFNLLRKMTPQQMALFVDTFARGDGHLQQEGGATITQKSVGNLDVLQAMAVLSGRSSTKYDRVGMHDFGALYVAKNSKRAHRKALHTAAVTLPMVWCPQTEHGTWLARRNGRTFVTGNSKPKWARGAVGSVIFTFKQYSISYVELIDRLWKSGPEGRKAALLMLAVLFLMGGSDGLPFADDANDVIDGVLQRLGYNFSSRAAKQEFFVSVLGKDLGRFAEKGISGISGVPIDMSGRLGMGNLIPGTGLVVKKPNHTRDVVELIGPAGDMGKRTFQAAGELLDGNPLKAATTVSPLAARNVVKAFDMASTGMYRDERGRKVIDVSGYDAVMKGLGFQPNDVARVQEAAFQTQQLVGQNKVRESEIADLWARGMFERNQGLVDDAREALARWNRTNPTTPIKIDMQQIRRRVAQMRASKTDRLAKTAPKEIRAQVRRELEAAQ